MHLQRLTIHNIASIADATIDFDAPPLATAEVFLITGKTGAGKSTILDCICLALFADTPRLRNTRMEGKTRDGDKDVTISDPTQLMRRNTGEAMVTLTFTGSNGVRYEATWSVQRAFRRPNGNLQGKKWQLTNLDTNETMLKDKDIQQEMRAAIGLDFNQFCRTTMLAQGEFTRFLNSKDEEKATILEKITGADSYSRIGRRVYELTAEKEQAWREANRSVEGVQTLSEEEVANLSAQLQTLTTEQVNLSKERESIARQLQTIKERHLAVMAAVERAKDRIAYLDMERRRRRQAEQTLAESAKTIERLRGELSELLPRLRDAEVRRDTCRTLYDRQRESVDKWAKGMRRKLNIGDTCPVCQQRVATLPDEAALDEIFGTVEKAWREADSLYADLTSRNNRLNAEIASSTRAFESARAIFEKESTTEQLEALAREACKACGIETIDEDTLTRLSALYDHAKAGSLFRLSEDKTDELLARQSQLDRQLNSIGEQKGAINQTLRQDSERRIRLAAMQSKAEALKQDFLQWSRLNQLIGDATGSKFRKIAQSYVLGSLIHAANSYMRTLTDRYTLLVEPGTFVISIEDAYQGFARRAASTISGGESFLVSLSLALALSDIGHRLAVDTLFIDEGFGTLSGEPLHAAIATLRSLHTKAGRHVGIISHIEELQERIPVQVRLEQETNHASSRVVVTTHA